MENREKVSELFASLVFSEDVMRERLPKDVYKSLINTIATGKELDPGIADVVAGAMKDCLFENIHSFDGGAECIANEATVDVSEYLK